ncbi:MAG TPA: hypothetical protein VLQ80_25850 [Candidatus Saccharimonadia bacterium]|nr:hypothetical protein [Candidatus Saccharimonadia bacterium]
MQSTVPQNPVPAKAFYCTFHGLSGVLTKPADHILFLEYESGGVVTLTNADLPHVVVNGCVADAMAQYISDQARGGAAKICTSRANLEV